MAISKTYEDNIYGQYLLGMYCTYDGKILKLLPVGDSFRESPAAKEITGNLFTICKLWQSTVSIIAIYNF